MRIANCLFQEKTDEKLTPKPQEYIQKPFLYSSKQACM